MRKSILVVAPIVLSACSSTTNESLDAGSGTDSGTPRDGGADSSPTDDSGFDLDSAVPSDASLVDTGTADAGEDAAMSDAGPVPTLKDAIAELIDSACDFQQLCDSKGFDARRVQAGADCIHAIAECDTTSGNGAPQVILACLEIPNDRDAVWYNCLGKAEACSSMPFIHDDDCLYFSMMSDAARAEGQACISMSACSEATLCLTEHIFDM
ncbi:MAG: hypothetical protein IPK60_11210 [Sandaracinaceae bacterium]|nr:hypothetical protein [Sandaracinaceae bacterium]